MSILRRRVIALPALIVAASAAPARAADAIVGSGVSARQARTPGAFAGVGVDGPFRVELRPATVESIEITADDNLLPLIETTVDRPGAALRIRPKPGFRLEPRTPVVVVVRYATLDAVALAGSGSIVGRETRGARLDVAVAGSGTVDLAGIDADAVSVSVGGSGRTTLVGRARRLAVAVGGSGPVDAERLTADRVEVTTGGSGDVRVRAEQALAVQIAGSGSVWHAGAATPRSAIVGSGRVRRLG